MEKIRKHSHKRDAILKCIRQTDTHPTADWIYAQLKPTIPELSLGTVYRNLAMFRQQGDIVSVGVVNGLERFDGNTKPHVHFLCMDCGAVLDIPSLEVPESLCAKAAQSTGGDVVSCSLSFTGHCHDCLRKAHGAH